VNHDFEETEESGLNLIGKLKGSRRLSEKCD